MADESKAQDAAEKSAEDRVRDAEAALETARAELAESQGELRAVRTSNMPRMVVEVLPNVHVSHEGKDYYGGEYGVRLDDQGNEMPDRMLHSDDAGTTLTIDGPTAMALVLEGKVNIIRSIQPDDEEEA